MGDTNGSNGSNGNNGSKIPMESRPLRLSPEVQRVIEARLRPLSGKRLEAAQEAVLKVYQSGKQQAHEQWLQDYGDAIASAVNGNGKADS
jgi:hypothetical protein